MFFIIKTLITNMFFMFFIFSSSSSSSHHLIMVASIEELALVGNLVNQSIMLASDTLTQKDIPYTSTLIDTFLTHQSHHDTDISSPSQPTYIPTRSELGACRTGTDLQGLVKVSTAMHIHGMIVSQSHTITPRSGMVVGVEADVACAAYTAFQHLQQWVVQVGCTYGQVVELLQNVCQAYGVYLAEDDVVSVREPFVRAGEGSFAIVYDNDQIIPPHEDAMILPGRIYGLKVSLTTKRRRMTTTTTPTVYQRHLTNGNNNNYYYSLRLPSSRATFAHILKSSPVFPFTTDGWSPVMRAGLVECVTHGLVDPVGAHSFTKGFTSVFEGTFSTIGGQVQWITTMSGLPMPNATSQWSFTT
jgi:hypothetical protein